MFKTIEHFVSEWKPETAMTEKLLAALTDASLGQEAAPGHRTLGRIAWHIVYTVHEMMAEAGLTSEAPEESPPPARAADILAAYRAAVAKFEEALRAQWTDAALAEKRPMYGGQWTGAEVLASLLKHEIHHRGQMTVLMRMAGLRVPGLYGPAMEEWAQFGAEPPAV